MIEKIESKIESYINTVLEKEKLTFCDYQVLVNELARLDAKAKAEKWAADQEKRNAALMSTMKGLLDSPIG
jgi:hypothetical protein